MIEQTHSKFDESGNNGQQNTGIPPRDSSILLTALAVLVFFIFGYAIYSNTFSAPFVFDDSIRIEDNADIRLDQFSIPQVIKAGFKSSKISPVAFITFALNYCAHQYDVFGYHFVNTVIHILTSFFLFLFIKATLKNSIIQAHYKHADLIAFFAALLWLVHPVQTQSVTYIVQRVNSLAALFYILALWLYVQGRLAAPAGKKWGWFGSATLAWIFALGCKPNAATLPFFVFLYEWYFFQDLSVDWLKRNLKIVILMIFVFGMLALLYLGFDPIERLSSINDFANKEYTLSERIMTQFRVVIHYISLIIFPHPSRLNLDYDFALSTSLVNPLSTLLSLLAIVCLIALAIYLAPKERLISFCILWFFGNLVIESSIIPLAIIFEHRNYLPSMMVCLIPVVLVYRYIKIDWIKIALLGALVIGLSVWTYQRNRVWEKKVTLWRDVVKKSPNKARPNFYLAAALTEQKRDQEAISFYERALDLNPNLVQAHINLGEALERQDKLDEALEHYRTALKLEPDLPEAKNNIGGILAKQGRTEEAIQYYQSALKVRPQYALAHFNLATALSRKGDFDQAINHYYTAIKIQPEYAEAHLKLGDLFLNLEEREKSINHYRAALQIDAYLVEAYNHLGIVLMREDKLEAAIKQFQKATQLSPGFIEAENNLKRALAIRKELETEISRITALLKDNPGDFHLHFQMGNIYFRIGDQRQAIQQYNKALRLSPRFRPALNNLALVTAANQEYYKALTIFLDILNYYPDDAETHYNIACMYSRLKRVDESIEWLKKAIDKGYSSWENIKRDGDLDNIRDAFGYRELIKGH